VKLLEQRCPYIVAQEWASHLVSDKCCKTFDFGGKKFFSTAHRFVETEKKQKSSLTTPKNLLHPNKSQLLLFQPGLVNVQRRE